MRLVKIRHRSGERAIGRLEDDGSVRPLNLAGGQYQTLTDILEADDPQEVAEFLTDTKGKPLPASEVQLLAPIDNQEVWAAGVTYKRSRTARMEESGIAGTCYDLVYASPRPELFPKATPHRVVGPGEPLRMRRDSTWNVPEPELTLVLNTDMKIVGYTVGNDMSSREIEGDNPLYLPQAKVYDQCCGLGPCITLAIGMPHREEIGIEMVIWRSGEVAFQGSTNVGEMNRTFENLVGWLARDNSFPSGVFLMTGTGIVPDTNFSLEVGDVVDITISGIGVLRNTVIQD